MDFRRGHLLYFVTVAEEGQITRAARRLHLAQPALSQAMAQLEADVGVRLLERHARGVSLTPAGEAFLVKARTALAAWSDAVETARSLALETPAVLELGFVGTPPALDSPAAFARFARAHPFVDVRFRELTFPTAPVTTWLADVDAAICHMPPVDSTIWTEVVRTEPRALLVPADHPLAGRSQLSAEELVAETFIGMHPRIEPEWAGFWSFDDVRGAPARHTPDEAINAQEVLAALGVRQAVTAVPASVAQFVTSFATGVVAIPVSGGGPVTIVLAGREDRNGPVVRQLRAMAGKVAGDAPANPPSPDGYGRSRRHEQRAQQGTRPPGAGTTA
jgi:DNA-binding transcriptional LysR family regulator